jgi:hypothetical protein
MRHQLLSGIQLVFTDHFAIGAQLMSEWLEVWDVAKLDSALCCNGRDKFLQLLSSNGVFIKSNAFTFYTSNKNTSIHWLTLRRGKQLHLSISTDENYSDAR